MSKQSETKAWLEGLPVLSELSEAQEQSVLTLLGSPAFGVFLGLMLGARQGFLMTLSNMPLGTAEAAARASVTQGIIKGIDLVSQTALELVASEDSSAAPSPGASPREAEEN